MPSPGGPPAAKNPLMRPRASKTAPRTVALMAESPFSMSARNSSPADRRTCVSLALCKAPSGPSSAVPRIAIEPASTAIALTARLRPSASGLTLNVALPGLPAAFSVPVCGFSTATWARSISTSALDLDSGALMRTPIGPFSNAPPGTPSLARSALSIERDNTTEPSSAAPLVKSMATGAPYIWPWPAIFRLPRSARTDSAACSRRSPPRKRSTRKFVSAPSARNCSSSGRTVFPSFRSSASLPSN